MARPEMEIEARIPDDGQWFERGVRVVCTRPVDDRYGGNVEKAALGDYEVLRCKIVRSGGQRWLSVKLRRFGYLSEPSLTTTSRAGRRPAFGRENGRQERADRVG